MQEFEKTTSGIQWQKDNNKDAFKHNFQTNVFTLYSVMLGWPLLLFSLYCFIPCCKVIYTCISLLIHDVWLCFVCPLWFTHGVSAMKHNHTLGPHYFQSRKQASLNRALLHHSEVWGKSVSETEQFPYQLL